MFMMVLKELWDSFVKSHKVFCRYCCNILIYDIMSSWTRRFLTHLNRVLVFRKLVLWAWNFLWGFIFWGCHFIIETVFVVAGNFTFFAFPWRILSETSAIGSKVELYSVYRGWGWFYWTKYFLPTLSFLFLAFHLPFNIHANLKCY